MKCEQCRNKIFEYVENLLSEDEDREIKNHIDNCEECRKIYENELIEFNGFRDIYSCNDVKFESSLDNIMKSIDKEKYKNKVVNRKTKKYIGTFAVAAAVLVGIIITPMIIRNNNDSNLNLALDKATESSPNAQIAKETKLQENESLGSQLEADKYSIENEKGISVSLYDISEVDINKKLDFNTSYINTSDNRYSATIEGKGELAIEEGQGILYIRDNNNSKLKEYKLKNINEESTQTSPLSISWYDNSNLIIVQGYAYGTIEVKGTEVIILNVETEEQTKIFSAEGNYRIKSVSKDGKDLIIKYGYFDDNFMNFTEEDKVIKNYDLGKMIK